MPGIAGELLRWPERQLRASRRDRKTTTPKPYLRRQRASNPPRPARCSPPHEAGWPGPLWRLEEKARAPGTGPPLWEAGGRGGQPSACSTFSRFRGLPDGQGAAWEWDDAGGRKAPGSRPTWRPSRRTPTVAPLRASSEVHTSAFQLLVAKRRGNRDRRVLRARD